MTQRRWVLVIVAVLAIVAVKEVALAVRVVRWLTRAPVDGPSLLVRHRADFERLREMIGQEPVCDEISIDHYEWVDDCNSGDCAGAAHVLSGRPPGVAARPCDGPGGCVRWVDDTPTPEVLAAICSMPIARATEYLDALERLGVSRVDRRRPAASGFDDAWFLLSTSGIITSGSETDLVWRRDAPSSTGSSAKGSAYSPVPDAPGWYLKHSWN